MGFLKDLLAKYLPQILDAVTKAAVKEVEQPVQAIKVVQEPENQPVQATKVVQNGEIDWTNPQCKVSVHFTVKEMLYLPTWKRMANEADGLNDVIKKNLIDLAKAMDIVREHFGKPINVHVTYRPAGYNKAIGGAMRSAHSDGQAMDFDIPGINCDDVRKSINDAALLEIWNMRMEDISALTSRNWVHLDRRILASGGHRFFKP
jgi:Peptidase M15